MRRPFVFSPLCRVVLWSASVGIATLATAHLGTNYLAMAQQGERKPAEPAAKQAGLHNVLRITPRLMSGSEPEAEAGFASLAALGVKTIVSVDGAQPNLIEAARHGLKYIHIPLGYDGIPADKAAALTRVMRDIPGPIYVHCHRGLHRGPAAAAVAAMSCNALDHESAKRLLQQAGTSPDYRGLYRDVASFKPPAADALLPELHESEPTPPLIDAMCKIDRIFDRLKLATPKPSEKSEGVERVAISETAQREAFAADALLIAENFREAERLSAESYSGNFRELLKDAEQSAADLHAAIKASQRDKVEMQIVNIGKQCKACHAAHRD